MDLEREIDRLYALPLAEFTAARDALARKLRAAGERDAAATVKKLAKPSVTAWAANAVVHHDARLFEELLDASEALRTALTGKGDRGEADRRRRAAHRALLRAAGGRLGAAGHAASPAARKRIGHTLEALATADAEAEGLRPGRLTRDLEPPGFDALAGLAASLAPAAASPGRRRKSPGKRAASARGRAARGNTGLAAIREEVAEREAEADRAEKAAAEAESAIARAAEQRGRLAAEAAEAERRADAAAEAAAAAAMALDTAEAAASEAKTTYRRAARRLAAARRRLERRQAG